MSYYIQLPSFNYTGCISKCLRLIEKNVKVVVAYFKVLSWNVEQVFLILYNI